MMSRKKWKAFIKGIATFNDPSTGGVWEYFPEVVTNTGDNKKGEECVTAKMPEELRFYTRQRKYSGWRTWIIKPEQRLN
jgi:hypothetical protein